MMDTPSSEVRALLLKNRIRDASHSRWLAGGLVLFAVAVLAGILVLLVLTGMRWHVQAVQRAEAQARSLSLLASDAVARTVQLVDATLQLTARRLTEGGASNLALNLGQELAFAPHLRQIIVTDIRGQVLYDSAATGVGTVDVGPYLDRLAAVGPGLAVGALQKGRFLGQDGGGRSLIPMARVVTDSDGMPVAVVVAAINVQYFLTLLRAAVAGEDGRVALYRHDGTLLAETAGNSDIMPRAHAGHALFSIHLPAAEFGHFVTAEADGTERITGYRMTHAWPLVVTVGLSTAAIDAQWRDDALSMALPAAMVAGILMVIATALTRVLLARAREEQALAVAARALVAVGDGVIICDAASPSLPILYVNTAFERITGYSEAETLGRNPRFLHGHDRNQPELQKVREALAAGQGITASLRNYRKDGSQYWVDLHITPVIDDAGHVTHYVGIQRDVTPQKQAEEANRRLITELVAASAKLQRFAFVASHELLQPIVTVQGFARVLVRRLAGAVEGTAAEALDEVVAGAARAHRMVSGLRDYFQLSASEEPFTAVECAALVESVVAEVWDVIIACDAQIDVHALPTVRADARQMRLLWRNLIENSLKFRHPGTAPAIVIAADTRDDVWHFTIRDNGIGVPPDRHEQIFDILSRLHGADYPGLGMGLPACRTIIERHGGRIWVESNAGEGCVIHFTLPAATATAPAEGAHVP